MKIAKVIYRNPHMFCGSKAFSGTREKALTLDEDHKPYVRAARSYHYLPDSWDDTKFIVRQKGWKARVRKRHQWLPHVQKPSEWAFVRGVRDWWSR